jgi:hypothetical protein
MKAVKLCNKVHPEIIVGEIKAQVYLPVGRLHSNAFSSFKIWHFTCIITILITILKEYGTSQ